jgi:hypothetical protein
VALGQVVVDEHGCRLGTEQPAEHLLVLPVPILAGRADLDLCAEQLRARADDQRADLAAEVEHDGLGPHVFDVVMMVVVLAVSVVVVVVVHDSSDPVPAAGAAAGHQGERQLDGVPKPS